MLILIKMKSNRTHISSSFARARRDIFFSHFQCENGRQQLWATEYRRSRWHNSKNSRRHAINVLGQRINHKINEYLVAVQDKFASNAIFGIFFCLQFILFFFVFVSGRGCALKEKNLHHPNWRAPERKNKLTLLQANILKRIHCIRMLTVIWWYVIFSGVDVFVGKWKRINPQKKPERKQRR